MRAPLAPRALPLELSQQPLVLLVEQALTLALLPHFALNVLLLSPFLSLQLHGLIGLVVRPCWNLV